LGTFSRLNIKEVRYGIDHDFPEERDEDVLLLLKKPFTKS